MGILQFNFEPMPTDFVIATVCNGCGEVQPIKYRADFKINEKESLTILACSEKCKSVLLSEKGQAEIVRLIQKINLYSKRHLN